MLRYKFMIDCKIDDGIVERQSAKIRIKSAEKIDRIRDLGGAEICEIASVISNCYITHNAMSRRLRLDFPNPPARARAHTHKRSSRAK